MMSAIMLGELIVFIVVIITILSIIKNNSRHD